jgi:poly-gamma-glutamate synthesis protein (capsule biosynthesis protein)
MEDARKPVSTAAGAVLALLVVAACTGAPDGEASPGPSAGPATTAPPSDSAAAPREPVVLAVHNTRSGIDVSENVARRLIAGSVRSWTALGWPPAPVRVVAAPGTPSPDRLEVASARAALRAVVRDRGTVAVVPAAAVGPEVRAIEVAGVDPLRRPGAYPICAAGAGGRPGPVVTVTVTGDIMLGRGVAEAAGTSRSPAPALLPMRRRLAAADVTVGNLESTLSRAGAPRQGGDSFAAAPRVVRGLRAAGFDVLSLANNHTGDFGDRALVETVQRLRRARIAAFGAGADAAQAWRPAVLQRRGVRFGFFGFNAIGETPAAAPGRPGAVSVSMPPRTGPLDRAELRAFLRAVRRLDREVDVVVVMPHWGTQYTNRQLPVQATVAERLVAAGADVVVGGHPHWVQGVEMVDGRLVVHSLGNFVFDMDFMRETQEGLLLELTFWGRDLKAADFVPYRMGARFAPHVVSRGEGADILRRMRDASGPAHHG